MKWSKYNVTWKNDDKFYLYNSICNTLAVSEQEFHIPLEDQTELVQNGFLVSDEIKEEVLAREKIREKIHTSDTLSCWIFLTTDCNLACPYCFEKKSFTNNNPEYMDITMCMQVVAWLMIKAKEKDVQKIHITLTGGEPLLNIEAIETIIDLFTNTEFTVTANVITNGVLLDKTIAERLYHHGVSSYQITLDGPPKIHDSRRKYKDGRGTFLTILKNILNIRQWNEQITFVIRINMDRQNCDEINKLLLILKKMNLEKFLAICINDTLLEEVTQTDVFQKIVKIIAQAQAYGFNISFGELNNCWMMSEYWYMINTDGNLYKCPSLVGMKQYCVGNVASHKLNQQYRQQTEIMPWEKCLDCALVGLCCGGCPYRNFLKNKQWEKGKICRKNYMMSLLQLKYNNLDE